MTCANINGIQIKLLEVVFAPRHYFATFWVNHAGLTRYGFGINEKILANKESKTGLNELFTLGRFYIVYDPLDLLLFTSFANEQNTIILYNDHIF